jgi:hypothetical protein
VSELLPHGQIPGFSDYGETSNSGLQYAKAHRILSKSERNEIVVMNSNKEVNPAEYRTATDPSVPFTVIFGGNLISRGGDISAAESALSTQIVFSLGAKLWDTRPVMSELRAKTQKDFRTINVQWNRQWCLFCPSGHTENQ